MKTPAPRWKLAIIAYASTVLTIASYHHWSKPANSIALNNQIRAVTRFVNASANNGDLYVQIQSLKLEVFCQTSSGTWVVRGSKEKQLRLMLLVAQGSEAEALRPGGDLGRILEYQDLKNRYHRTTNGATELEDASDYTLENQDCTLVPLRNQEEHSEPRIVADQSERQSDLWLGGKG